MPYVCPWSISDTTSEVFTSTRLFSKSCKVCNCGINFWIIFEKASKIEWSKIEVIWYSIGTSVSPSSASSSPIRCCISLFISEWSERIFPGVDLADSRSVSRRLYVWRLQDVWKDLQPRLSLLWNVTYSMPRYTRPARSAWWTKVGTCASMTKINAPISPNIESKSNVGSKKSIWPGKSHTWKSIKELKISHKSRKEYFILSLVILVVDSKKSVSFGCILWKTTLCIDDFPLLRLSAIARLYFSPPISKQQ